MGVLPKLGRKDRIRNQGERVWRRVGGGMLKEGGREGESKNRVGNSPHLL